jgi:ribosomal protein S6--L-glutamate ligase
MEEKMPKICLIMESRNTRQLSPVLVEAIRFLTEWGASVDTLFPEELTIDISRLEVAYDLYVLKSKSELAFSLAGVLHAAGANILNPYPVARMIRNKALMARVLQEADVPVPDSYIALSPQMLAPLLDNGPLIIKPITGSRGYGIQVVRDAKVLDNISSPTKMVFAQRYHKPEGPDHKIYVIGGEVFGVKRVWPSETYQQKLGEPVSVSPEVREIALRCGRAFGVELYGIDIIWSGGEPYVVDMSSLPGFKGCLEGAHRIARYIETVCRRILNKEPMLPTS